MGMSRDEVFAKVRDVLVDALGVDADEVKEDAQVMADLGATSDVALLSSWCPDRRHGWCQLLPTVSICRSPRKKFFARCRSAARENQRLSTK